MGILIDSSVLIDVERAVRRDSDAGRDVLQRLTGEPGFLAAITVSELFHGVHRAANQGIRARRETFVRASLEIFRTLPFDRNVAEVHSRIWSDLQSEGRVIGSHDLLIAATGLSHGMPLLTGNVDEFGRVEGLEILPWSS